MIIKNRKLIRRDDLDKIAEYIDLDRLKADAEAAMLEIPTDFWYGNANEADSVDNLFVWLLTDKTPHPLAFWRRVHRYFTVEPLPPNIDRLAEIDADIARLTAEREKLMQGETRRVKRSRTNVEITPTVRPRCTKSHRPQTRSLLRLWAMPILQRR